MAITWLRNSFMWIRMRKNPVAYRYAELSCWYGCQRVHAFVYIRHCAGVPHACCKHHIPFFIRLPPACIGNISTLEAHLKQQLVLETVEELCKHELLVSDSDGFSLSATQAGAPASCSMECLPFCECAQQCIRKCFFAKASSYRIHRQNNGSLQHQTSHNDASAKATSACVNATLAHGTLQCCRVCQHCASTVSQYG